MRHVFLVILSSFTLVGCAVLPESWRPASQSSGSDAATEAEPSADINPPASTPPPPDARTVEAFDTTTKAERTAAVSEPTGQEQRLGTTIASLGDVSETGLWMKTPLVDAPGKGRVAYPPTGASVAVDLVPLGGDAGAGSQLSLAAMRLLNLGLTDLPEVEVFSSGI